jgi:hypothetical protein
MEQSPGACQTLVTLLIGEGVGKVPCLRGQAAADTLIGIAPSLSL